jgi:uncharacterized protein with PIN domain
MAVHILAKETLCSSCHEKLEYTTADVIRMEKVLWYVPIQPTLVTWLIRCPTCSSVFRVDKHFRFKAKRL